MAPSGRVDLSLSDYLEQWLADGEWRANTYRLRRVIVRRHIIPHIGTRTVGDLGVDDIKALHRRLRELGAGAATRRQVHVTLRAALGALVRERKLAVNPCALVPSPRYEPAEKTVLDRDQVRALIAAADGRLRTAIVLASTLGIREGELFGLTWDAVDLERRTVVIARQVAEDRAGRLVLSALKTKASRRTLALPGLAVRALAAWRERQRASGYGGPLVFADSRGNPLRKSNFLRRDFKPLLRRAGLPDVTFHSLRHSSNSFLIEEGADPLLVARRNGHASTRMVLDRYGHVFAGSRRLAADAMDRVFGPQDPGLDDPSAPAVERETSC